MEIVIPGRPIDGNEIFTFDTSQLRPKLRTINTNLNRQYIVPSLRSFSSSPKVFDNSRIDQKRKVMNDTSGDYSMIIFGEFSQLYNEILYSLNFRSYPVAIYYQLKSLDVMVEVTEFEIGNIYQ